MKVFFAVLACSLIVFSVAFAPQTRVSSRSGVALKAFDGSTIAKLEDIQEKYKRLANLDSADADAERDSLAEIAEKYGTYKEEDPDGQASDDVESEASESRKARQLKSFTDLYKGQLSWKSFSRRSWGSSSRRSSHIPELDAVTTAEARVAELERELERVTYRIPEGMSTRDERFFGNPQHRVPQLP